MKFVLADIVNQKFNQYYLDESKKLIKTYGGHIDHIFLQNRNYSSSASYVGHGKAREIAQYCLDHQIDVFVINNMIRPSVYNTLRKYFPWETQIWDKIDLILNIFDKHSHTKEAKLQIEYARTRYELPRLQGLGKQLSNLGAGIGTRGPGEKIMETKRRHLKKHLNNLQKQINARKKVLKSQRSGRQNFKTAVFVGYSNVGKSTLFKAMTNKDVIVKDVLFATLDNRIARLKTTYPNDYLLIDTIGFIAGIPPLVINSFLPILEELKYADAVIFTMDISLLAQDEDYFSLQFHTMLDIMKSFSSYLRNTKLIMAFNKADKAKLGYDDISTYIDLAKSQLDFISEFDWRIGSSFHAKQVGLLKKKLTKI